MWKTMEMRQQRRNDELASEASLMMLAIAAGFNGGKAAKLFAKTIKEMTG